MILKIYLIVCVSCFLIMLLSFLFSKEVKSFFFKKIVEKKYKFRHVIIALLINSFIPGVNIFVAGAFLLAIWRYHEQV